MGRPKIGLVKVRTNHAIIPQIIRLLQSTFPEYDLEVVEIKQLLRRRLGRCALNGLSMLRLYRDWRLANKSTLYNRFLGTPYMFYLIKEALEIEVPRGRFAFTFQDCSLFDGAIRGVPHFVYTDHTVWANRDYPDFDPRRDLLADEWLVLEGEIYRNARRVFARSKRVRDSVVRDYGVDESQAKTLYHAPFDEELLRPLGRERYGSRTILFVGVDWHRKGGDVLVHAFRKVHARLPEARLQVVGCRPRVAEPGVEVVGPVPKEEIGAYYENAAVFCMPTRHEPFGIVFLEAMRYELPIVATRVGSVPEIVTDGSNGFLVTAEPEPDADALAHRLLTLLESPERAHEMGRWGGAIYRERFSFQNVSRRLRTYVEEAL